MFCGKLLCLIENPSDTETILIAIYNNLLVFYPLE